MPGASAPFFLTYNIAQSFVKINMKIYRNILIILTILFLYEGFNSEFYDPTFFDWLKWLAWLICAVTYFICSRRVKKMRLKEIRTQKGLSVPQLVELSGIPRRTIQDLESRGDGRVSTAIKLADALGVTLDELCRDEQT